MFNAVDSKQTWLGIALDSDPDPTTLATKQELISKGTPELPVFVFSYASSWVNSGEKNERAAKRQKTDGNASASVAKSMEEANQFAFVKWDFLQGFHLYFYGNVGLDSKGTCVALVVNKEGPECPSLPWQISSAGWDSLMNAEMPCLAFTIQPVKASLKAGKGNKIKAGQVTQDKTSGKDATQGSSGNCEEFIAQVMGIKGSGKAKKRAKKKAGKKDDKAGQLLSDTVQFIEAPLFLQ